MKFRPKMVFYFRKKVLGISRDELAHRVHNISKGDVCISEDRIARLEDPEKYKQTRLSPYEFGILFKALEQRASRFWK